MEADDSHRFYLRKISMIEVPANGTLPVPAADPGKQRGAKHGGDDHGGRRASQAAYKRGAAFALIVQRQESGLRASFEKALTGFFGELGKARSDEHTSELQSLMRISYSVFCLNKKNTAPCTPLNLNT